MLEINKDSVLKQLGFFAGKSEISDEIDIIIDEEIENTKNILIPQKILKTCKIEFQDETSLRIFGGFTITSKSLFIRLQGSFNVYIFAVTVGGLITKKMNEYVENGEISRAIVADAIGSVSVEFLADKVNQEIINLCSKKGQKTTKRFSPGYGDWSISDQKPLLNHLDGEKIGINLTENYQMIPEKSISAIVGVLH